MIRPLRQAHRRTFIALGIFLPLTFAAGIAARRPVPAADSLPPELASVAARFETLAAQPADFFGRTPVRVRLLRERGGAEKFAVELSAAKNFVKPDLIVYWVAGNPNLTDTLPDKAILLGAFGTTMLLLPAEAAKSEGRLVLFSLADNEIVDVSQPFRLNDSTK
jgi:hypothetical protein